MTKHGHRTFEEFKKDWNLDTNAAQARMYELDKNNWISKRKLLFNNIAISNIKELILEAGDRPANEVYDDILNVIANLHDREVNHTKW